MKHSGCKNTFHAHKTKIHSFKDTYTNIDNPGQYHSHNFPINLSRTSGNYSTHQHNWNDTSTSHTTKFTIIFKTTKNSKISTISRRSRTSTKVIYCFGFVSHCLSSNTHMTDAGATRKCIEACVSEGKVKANVDWKKKQSCYCFIRNSKKQWKLTDLYGNVSQSDFCKLCLVCTYTKRKNTV